MSAYKNQTKYRLQADTNLSAADHAALTAQTIKWKKPSGLTGSFTATAGTAPYIYYDTVNSTDISESGDWIIWAYCTFTGAYVAAGDPYGWSVKEQGILI